MPISSKVAGPDLPGFFEPAEEATEGAVDGAVDGVAEGGLEFGPP